MPTGTQSQSAAMCVRAARWSRRATRVGTCTAHAKFTNTESPSTMINTGARRPGISWCRCSLAERGGRGRYLLKPVNIGPPTIWMIERRYSTCARQANPQSGRWAPRAGTVDRALESDRSPRYQRAPGLSSCDVFAPRVRELLVKAPTMERVHIAHGGNTPPRAGLIHPTKTRPDTQIRAIQQLEALSYAVALEPGQHPEIRTFKTSFPR